MGRENRFPHSLAFRLDEAAFETLKDVAAAHGMAPSAFARFAVLKQIGTSELKPPVIVRVLHADILRGIAGELARLGNLLNQVARKLNSGDAVSSLAIATLKEELGTALRALVDALGGPAKP